MQFADNSVLNVFEWYSGIGILLRLSAHFVIVVLSLYIFWSELVFWSLLWIRKLLYVSNFLHYAGIFKPPPPVVAGGGYMFSGRPCVCASVRPSLRVSVRPWFTWLFYVSAISPVSVDGFSPNFCHWCISGQRWPDYVFGSKGQSSGSRHPGGGTQHSTLSSSATFSSFQSWWRFLFSECFLVWNYVVFCW